MPSPTNSPSEDDVFLDNANDEPVIVDGDVLEAAKENIQPLASGRRATSLSAILSTPHAQREQKLSSMRNRLRINVEVALEDEDDDPLDAYCHLVYWTVENYPQGHSAESGLLELLEEATRVLKDDREGQWKEDMRYLKLWVLYATYVERPAIIYRFLLANEIGTAHALLYEEFAIILERNGRLTEADATYLLGINRKAVPIDRLQTKHREFQKRMMTSTTFSHASPPNPTDDDDSVSQTQVQPKKRAVLAEAPRKGGTASSTSGTRTTRSRNGSGQAISSSSTTSGPEHPRTASSSSRPAPPNARLQIFEDPAPGTQEGDGENEPPEPEAPTPWAELGTRVSRVKENMPEVKKMRGTTLRAGGSRGTGVARTVARAGGPRLEIFKDPEPEAGAGDVLDGEENDEEGDQEQAETKPRTNGTGSSSKAAGKAAFAPVRDETTTTMAKTKALRKPTIPSLSRSTTKIPTSVASSMSRAKPAFAPFVDPGSASEVKSAQADQSKTTTRAAKAKAKPSGVPTRSTLASTSKASTSSKAAFLPFVEPRQQDTAPLDKGKSKIASSSSSSTSKGKAKAPTPAFTPFVDLDATATRSKTKVASSASLASKPEPAFMPFKDPAPDDDEVAAKAPTKAQAAFVPFVDEPENAPTNKGKEKEKEKKAQIMPVTPAKPTFTPFRDEPMSPTSAACAGIVPDSVMKPKKAVLMSSEADALRKDPFKNYKDVEKIMGDGLDAD